MEILMFELVIQHSSILGHVLGHFSCPLGELISQEGPQILKTSSHIQECGGVRWVSALKSNRET